VRRASALTAHTIPKLGYSIFGSATFSMLAQGAGCGNFSLADEIEPSMNAFYGPPR
jgi:hypothetical protein